MSLADKEEIWVPAGLTSVQRQQTSTRWLEAAGAVTQRAQAISEVYVQVLATGGFGTPSGMID